VEGRPLGSGRLRLAGAAEHNLQQIDLELELGQWIAITGPSGSGKTSLVFDTLVREGQHRYLGGLSPKARQFFGKLGRAKLQSLRGMPAAVATGSGNSAAGSRSTVGTQSGGLDLMRLLYAREAVDPEGFALTRSHFSFNHPLGACEACSGRGVEDRVDPGLLVADGSKSLRAGALVPTLKSGYTVYSQVTLEVMGQICSAHGFDVDTPWDELSQGQRHVILYGSKSLKVPFGKHSLESRMRWEGITARPREEGYYRGLVPVIEETLQRSRNPGVLRFVRSGACEVCNGTRLARPGREARVGQMCLPELLALPADGLLQALAQLPESAVLTAVEPSLLGRLGRMQRLGLGHLALARSADSLSAGETQRLALVAQLSAGLGGLLIALDEPTLGLHPEGQAGMGAVLEELLELGNTLAVVEHDPDMVRWADHLLSLGPGAGSRGGQIVHDGALPEHPLGNAPVPKAQRRAGSGELVLRGASLHNLQSADLHLRLGAFNVVMGPSGAGKSSLVFGTLLPALSGTSGGAYEALEGAPSGGVAAADARPIGRTPRSTPATWTGLFDLVRKRFAATEAARVDGLSAGDFSYNNKAGRCPRCEGLGFERIGLHLLEDLERTCPDCAGGRYAQHVLGVRLFGRTIAEVLQLTVDEACEVFAKDEALHRRVSALAELGLEYLPLGQASNRLSRGEAQRVKLASLLGDERAGPSLLLLDEPDRGLHPSDIELLLRAFGRLIEAGHTIIAISHHRALWAAADSWTELRDGRAVHQAQIDWSPQPTRPPRARGTGPTSIELRGVSTHNLRGIDVSIPHGRLTVVVGVSGSGKSSLAFDTLAAEAWQRFAESLPFQVRRFVRRQPKAQLDSASGLGPVTSLRQGQSRAGARSTVATQTEIGPLLRLLWSRAGLLDGEAHELTAEHFSPDRAIGACSACEGMGQVQRCDPALLIGDASLSLAAGALDGTRVGRYLGEAEGQTLPTLRAAAEATLPDADLDLPWEELSAELKELALHGAGERKFDVTWSFTRGGLAQKHHFVGRWEGLLALAEREALRRAKQKTAAAWAEPLAPMPCEECKGMRIGAQARRALVGVWSLPALLDLPLELVPASLRGAELDARAGELREALLPELEARVLDLTELGLGHLQLSRSSATLSEGELQRVRLAGALHGGLVGMTIVLDEPSAGLHDGDVSLLVGKLKQLVEQGNTLVVVEHRPAVIRAAEYLIELGPGAGAEGGELLAAGPGAEILAGDGPTAQALRAPAAQPSGALTTERLWIRGACANHLDYIDVHLPAEGFVAIAGPSGSGKSSLLRDVLRASMEAGQPRQCESLEGFERFRKLRTPGAGRTLLSMLDLAPAVQSLYHAEAKGSGLARKAFSFDSPAGRCETCKGSGTERVPMDFMGDLALPCPSCAGQRFRPEVLAVHWNGLHVAAFLSEPASALVERLSAGPLRRALEALLRLDLGHLSLGRSRASLSGGERQRVLLASCLLDGGGPDLILLDEPASGLHEADLLRLAHVLQELGTRGHLVIAAEHRSSLLGAANWCVELGPGSGALGGRLLRSEIRE
jgi:excinuclease ABC subunit A